MEDKPIIMVTEKCQNVLPVCWRFRKVGSFLSKANTTGIGSVNVLVPEQMDIPALQESKLSPLPLFCFVGTLNRQDDAHIY